MIITYFGNYFFRIQSGEKVLAFNPSNNSDSKKATKFGADIGIVNVKHEDYQQLENIRFGGKDPFIISDPGDYETKDVYVQGFLSKTKINDKKHINTVYSINLEDINIVFLGPVSSVEDAFDGIKGNIDSCDVLFVPVGSESLKPSEAYKISLDLSAKVIIPMAYNTEEELSQFLKEGGEGNEEPQDKLTLKKKDLSEKEGDIVVLRDVS